MIVGLTQSSVAATNPHVGARNGAGRNLARQTADVILSMTPIHQAGLTTRWSIKLERFDRSMSNCQSTSGRQTRNIPNATTGASSKESPHLACLSPRLTQIQTRKNTAIEAAAVLAVLKSSSGRATSSVAQIRRPVAGSVNAVGSPGTSRIPGYIDCSCQVQSVMTSSRIGG